MSTDVRVYAWKHSMTTVLDAYVEALLWTSRCLGEVSHDGCRGEDCDTGFDDLGFTAEDFAPDVAAEIEEEVRDFVTSCLAERPDAFDDMDAGQVGHDFCLTRQGHGTGFWDRGLGERGEWLSGAAKFFGDTSAHVGDSGRLYVHG